MRLAHLAVEHFRLFGAVQNRNTWTFGSGKGLTILVGEKDSTELLLLSESAETAVPLLLIEEPEAHLHPQLQLRLMEFLAIWRRGLGLFL